MNLNRTLMKNTTACVPIAMRKACFCLFVLTPLLVAQPQAPPPRTFATHCTICHGGDANGTDRAPGIIPYVTSHSDGEISALVHNGRPDRGMPRFDFNDTEMTVLTGHLRNLASGSITVPAGTTRGVIPPPAPRGVTRSRN